ncbi:MAG: hypothetical protein NWT08_14385 [Akkermansiaceae bacterium]|jgi:hypothetical protein|nr:hypothetical protein [Akkermansiaceae bacterium]MDP4646707.1 hypothetical protein [Akkermansiaceae bacterium]MDP4721084.1 hypothetical protein [Akkermansiaceae bacterium]MDP4779623.1 hypothetical protein [Akkermansiaceae bacterium]MDP4846297.1 hypothetical protein [Akkermansiaceae bacterium]
MSATIETEQELKEEAFAILSQHLSPHKVARLLSIWQIGKGDYVKDRDALFANETVDSLFQQAVAQQSK